MAPMSRGFLGKLGFTPKCKCATGAFSLPATTSASAGVITQNGISLMHTFGFQNFFAGGAGNFTMSGSNNTASGYGALVLNTSGFYNTASGYHALVLNTTGYNNTASGHQALNNNTTGYSNTANGYQALYYNVTGSNNIAVGDGAGFSLTMDNNIDIGNGGVAGEAGIIRIGIAGTQTKAFIAGISGATSSGGVAVFVNASGQLGTVTSSRRFKQNIAAMNAASEAILSLRPVTFQYKAEIDPKGIPQFGLIAEEVNAINPDLVVRDDKGEIHTVRYEQVNAMLLNEFLKDHRRAEAKDAEIASLKQRLAELEAKDKEREARVVRLESLLPSAPVQPGAKTATTTNGN